MQVLKDTSLSTKYSAICTWQSRSILCLDKSLLFWPHAAEFYEREEAIGSVVLSVNNRKHKANEVWQLRLLYTSRTTINRTCRCAIVLSMNISKWGQNPRCSNSLQSTRVTRCCHDAVFFHLSKKKMMLKFQIFSTCCNWKEQAYAGGF